MIVNLEKSKEEFLKYTENYDLENESIKRKQLHSLRVMRISKEIASGLNLNDDEKQIATLIGLLHDIARFEQYTQYKTFRDKDSIDHGDSGAKILEKDIRKYIETDKYDEIIIKAVKNHNKYSIEEGLTEKELLFAKLIRDADKIDILYEAVEIFNLGTEIEVENSKISPTFYEKICSKEQIKRTKNMQMTPADRIISFIAFIFDINFKTSFQIIQRENYINQILDRYNFKDKQTKEEVEKIREIANNYIKEKTLESD